jgi:hypothetical protein
LSVSAAVQQVSDFQKWGLLDYWHVTFLLLL